ncbi:hypothetical protein EV363DRAFT_1192048, partial [Boletus edulis]
RGSKVKGRVTDDVSKHVDQGECHCQHAVDRRSCVMNGSVHFEGLTNHCVVLLLSRYARDRSDDSRWKLDIQISRGCRMWYLERSTTLREARRCV